MRVLDARITMQDTIIDALRQGNATQALPLAREWASNEPGNAQAHRLLAAALRLAGDQEAALECIDQAINLAPEDASLHFERAGLLLGNRQLDEAQAELARSTGLDPNLFPAYVMQAQLALGRGDLDEAERLARLASRIAPDHPRLAAIEGMVLLYRGDTDRALKTVTAALDAAPEDEQLRLAVGFVYMGKKLWAFAEQAFRTLIEDKPQSRQLRAVIADLVSRQGRYGEAAEWLHPLLAGQAGTNPALNRLAARLYLAGGQPEQALPLLRAALAAEPDNRETLSLLVTHWQQQDDRQDARQTLEAALATSPQAPNLWLARLAFEPLGSDEAAALITRWLKAMPQSLQALQASMSLHLHRGQSEAAEAEAKQILDIAPGNAAAQATVLDVLQSRDPQAAVAHVESLLEKAGSDASRELLHDWLGRVQDRAGRTMDAATTWIAQARARSPQLLPLPPVGLPIDQVPVGTWPPLSTEKDTETTSAIFLWGPPGSGVERVAAVLSSSPYFRNDRFNPGFQGDGFQSFGSVEDLLSGAKDGREVIEEWQSKLPARGITEGRIIEWLVWWDHAFLCALRPHLPNGMLLAVMRDPRDMLLEWLAFGSPSQISMTSPLQSAHWMADSLRQFLTLNHDALYPHALVRIDGIEDDPAALTEALKAATGLEAPVPPVAIPAFFKSGHWRNYAEALAEPFAVLTPVAVALGYPET